MSNRTVRLIKIVPWGAFCATIVLVASMMTGNYNVSWAQEKPIICSDIDQVLSLTFNTGGSISPIDTVLIRARYLEEMRENGQLLSSDEFASRITSYYDTLVAVLAGLFIVFSLTTYFSIKQSFETKFEDKRREIEDKQKELESQLSDNIRNELKNMLRDSRQVRDDIVSAVTGVVDGNFATTEALDELSSYVGGIGKIQEEIIAEVADLQEHIASMAMIQDKAVDSSISEEPDTQTDSKKEV